ncbi:MAG TPA: lytic transglycosylase domain-containing protein [Methylomirabilota bacterium]
MNRPGYLVASARLREHLRLRTRESWERSRSGSRTTFTRWSGSRNRLAGCAALVLTVISGYTASQRHDAWEQPRAIIKEAADRYGVAEDVIAAVIEAESQFNPRAVSRRGAQGLMQLMPDTAASLGVEDPFSPRENIHGGVRHLRSLMDRFDNNLPLALAAYNAGHVAVIHYGGIPPYPQTRAYVSRILRRLEGDGATRPSAVVSPRDRPRVGRR